MSRIPTFTSRAPIPTADFSGQAAIGRSLQQTGDMLGNLALSLRRTRRTTELAESRARVLTGMDEIAAEVETINDPDEAAELFDERVSKLRDDELQTVGGDNVLESQVESFIAERGAMTRIGVQRKITGRVVQASTKAVSNFEDAITSRIKTGDLSDEETQMLQDDHADAVRSLIGLTHTEQSAQSHIALFNQQVQDAREEQLTGSLEVGANESLTRFGGEAGGALTSLVNGAVARGLPVDQAVDAVVDAVVRQAITDGDIGLLDVMADVKVGGASLMDRQKARDEFDSARQDIAKRNIERDKRERERESQYVEDRINALHVEGIAMLQENINADTREIEQGLGRINESGLRQFLTLKSAMQSGGGVTDDPDIKVQLTSEALRPESGTRRRIIEAINARQLTTGTGMSLYNQAINSERTLREDSFLSSPEVKDAISTAESMVVVGIRGSDMVAFKKEDAILAMHAKSQLQRYIYDLRTTQPDMTTTEFADAVHERAMSLLDRFNPGGSRDVRQKTGDADVVTPYQVED